MVKWNVDTFEVPDVIGYEDYLRSARDVATVVGDDDRRGQPPRPIESFPYPNPPKPDPRWLNIADIHDLVALRTAAGEIIKTTDRLLSSCVRSSRLDSSHPGAWRFKDPGGAHRDFRGAAVAYLRRSRNSMCQSDVSGYYSSINLTFLAWSDGNATALPSGSFSASLALGRIAASLRVFR